MYMHCLNTEHWSWVNDTETEQDQLTNNNGELTNEQLINDQFNNQFNGDTISE